MGAMLKQRAGLLLALALLTGLLTVALLLRPLLPIDETRYLTVAWEMWLNGNWLVAHLNGAPYAHKPPLLFWLINIVWHITGVNALAARLVAPAFALTSVLLTWILAGLLWPQRKDIANSAALILVSINLWTFSATLTMFDGMLTAFTLVSLIGVLRAARGMRYGWILLAAGVGGGLLSKGPVVLVHVLPVALTLPWLARIGGEFTIDRNWNRRVVFASLLAVALVALWVVPAVVTGGEAYREAILWKQTVGRISHSFAHQRPSWWYFPLLPLLLFPWLIVWVGRKRWRGQDVGVRACLIWLAGALLVFSLISGKQIHYLVPDLPGFALATAWLIHAQRTAHRERPVVWATLGLLVAAAVASFNSQTLQLWRGCDGCLVLSPWWGVSLLVTAIAMLFITRSGKGIHATALGMVALWAVIWSASGPFAAKNYDVATPAARIQKLQRNGQSVVHLGKYHGQFQFLGRLQQPLLVIATRMQLHAWVQAGHTGHVLVYVSRDASVPLSAAELVVPFRARYAVLFRAQVLRGFDDKIWAQIQAL